MVFFLPQNLGYSVMITEDYACLTEQSHVQGQLDDPAHKRNGQLKNGKDLVKVKIVLYLLGALVIALTFCK